MRRAANGCILMRCFRSGIMKKKEVAEMREKGSFLVEVISFWCSLAGAFLLPAPWSWAFRIALGAIVLGRILIILSVVVLGVAKLLQKLEK